MASSKVYLDSCCFTELATFDRFAEIKNQGRLEDLRVLRDILKSHLSGDLEVFTSTLSVAECQYVKDPSGAENQPVHDDEVKALFRSMLMSGKFCFLVQDTPLVADSAVNLRWVHGISLKGADAVHVASAVAIGCVEFLTFDGESGGGILAKESEIFAKFGLRVILPRKSQAVPKQYDPESAPLLKQFDELTQEGSEQFREQYLKLISILRAAIAGKVFTEPAHPSESNTKMESA